MSCKKGNPEGVPLDNKFNNTNITNQCEIKYKIDPFKSTNCIPKYGYWYIDKNNYIMNLDKCPNNIPFIVNGTNQCVKRFDNRLEYSYKGTLYYFTDNGKYFHSNKTYCIIKCPSEFKPRVYNCNKDQFIHYYLYYALFMALCYML